MQRPQLSRQHISSPLTVVDSDDEEGPVVEGWSIFENSTDSSSSETTLGLDAPQSPIWEDRLESFLRRRRAFSVDHEAAATPTKKRTKRAPARKTSAPLSSVASFTSFPALRFVYHYHYSFSSLRRYR